MKKLISLMAVMLLSVSVWAQFGEPKLQKATQLKIDGTTEYYLSVTNSEGEEYFYGKGNDWGTRTSAKMDIEDALLVRFRANPTTIDSVEYNTVRFNNYVSDKGGWNAFADCDAGLQAWVDGQGRTGDGLWIITDKGNGQIQLANVNAPGGLLSFPPSRSQWSEDDQEYFLVESQDGYGFDNRLWFVGAPVDSVDILDEMGEPTGEKRPVVSYGDEVYSTWQLWDASLYDARMQICNWYWNDVDEEGHTGKGLCEMYKSVQDAADAAQKVYDNPNATVEELNAAYAAIIAAVDMISIDVNRDALADATDTNPIDLFEVGIMQNNDYSNGRTDGWDVVLTGNNNQVQRDSYSGNGVAIQNFLETWTWNSQLDGSGYVTQKVGLPDGLYVLGVDMIAARQSGSKADVKGVELFVKSDTQEFSIPVATDNNTPEHFELVFVAKEGAFTVGVRYNGTTCNWICVDNFTLNYYGNTPMSLEQINLGKVVADIDRMCSALEIVAHKTAVDEYNAAYTAASKAYENGGLADAAAYTALGDSLYAKYNQLVASIDDYKFFAQCIKTVKARVDEMEETDPACAEEIAGYLVELEKAYAKGVDGEGEWTRDQMNGILPHVADIMAKYADIQPGDDVTFYLNNPKFTENFSGWNVDGATPDYMNNHGQGENYNEYLCQEIPEENDGLAECYHNLFDMSQTIKNLPAGLYTLSVQGFNRSDDGVNEPAQLYATFSNGTEQTVNIADINEYKTKNKLYENNQWSADAGRDGDTYWVPNGMTGAAWHFVNKSDGENYDYTNKFSILMKEDGDLTVGVRVQNTHQWVIWDNFRLVYEGSGSSVWASTLEEEIARIETKVATSEITTGEKNAIKNELKAAQNFIANIDSVTEEDCLAKLDSLKGLENLITVNLQLQAEIETYYEELDQMWEKADEADKALQDRFYEIWEIVDGDFDDLDNEGLINAIAEANEVIALLKMPKGWENASDENPVDFTAMIKNPQFNVDDMFYEPDEDGYVYEPSSVTNHIFTEWQGKQPGTGGGDPANCGEVWNSSAFDMYQDLEGLPEGTYVLECQGFLRHGSGSTESYNILNGIMEQQVYAYLYAVSSENKYATELNNIASVQLTLDELESQNITGATSTFGENYKAADQLATADKFFKAGYYKNEVVAKVGADGILRIGIEKINNVGGDWVVFDNFKLRYMGKNSHYGENQEPEEDIHDWPSLLALQGAVRTADQYMDTLLVYQTSIRNRLIDAVAKGQDLVSANSKNDSTNVNTATAINNAIADARSSMVAYKEFAGFLEEGADYISMYDDSTKIGTRLNELLLSYEEGYNNRTYSNHEIRVIIDGFEAKVAEIIEEIENNPIDPGTDVSEWLVNPSFADGFNGWTNSQGGSPIGNVGGLDICPDVEVYENIVDIQQIVTNVPDGIYSLECQAFERPAANGRFTGDEESKVFLYMNEFQTPVQNIVKDAMPEEDAIDQENCYIGDGSGSWPYDYYVSGYGWIPNSVDGASYAFSTTPKRYVQKAYGLVEGGNMKIGLTSNGKRAHWVLWANFKLTFEGKTVKSLTVLLNTSMQKCQDIWDRHELSWPVYEDLEAAYNDADDALYSNDVNRMWNALIALNAQINEAQKNVTLMEEFQNELENDDVYAISNMIDEMEDVDLGSEYDEIFNIDPYDYDNNEILEAMDYIRDFISRVKKAYAEYLAQQNYDEIAAIVANASDENPMDITWQALVNPDMEEGSSRGWTLDLQTYTNMGYQGMSYIGDMTEVDGEEYQPYCTNFIEVWRMNNNPILGDIYQMVKLPAGTYRLGADMIASFQGGNVPVHGCYLVANDTHLEVGTANGVPQHFELYFKLTKPTVVKLGINCTSITSANWLAADNFTLTAYGTDSEKEANGEKIDDSVKYLELAEGWNWVSVNHYGLANSNDFINFLYDYANELNYVASQTQNSIFDEYYWNWYGDLRSMAPGLGYKVQATKYFEIELEGDYCSPAYTNINLDKGWNWIGYTAKNAQAPNVALAEFDAQEGDVIKSQDGFIIFQNGAWTENLQLTPGQGYLYYSNADYMKTVNFVNGEQGNGRNAVKELHQDNVFAYDVHRYANNMAIIAQVDAQNAADLEVYAFAGEECRGKSVLAADLQLVTVHGDKNGEEISFIIYNKVSGEMFLANESVKYNGSKMGTANSPVVLTLGNATSIAGMAAMQQADTYNMQGIKVGKTSQKGLYIKGGNKVVIK